MKKGTISKELKIQGGLKAIRVIIGCFEEIMTALDDLQEVNLTESQ